MLGYLALISINNDTLHQVCDNCLIQLRLWLRDHYCYMLHVNLPEQSVLGDPPLDRETPLTL